MQAKTVNLEYTKIPTLLEPIEFFIDKIRNEEVFHFYKINHGMLDSIWYGYENEYKYLETLLLEKNYDVVAEKIYQSFNGVDWGLNYWHGNTDKSKILSYLCTFLKVLCESKDIHPKIHTGLSLGVGLGLVWGVYDGPYPQQVGRTEVAKTILNVNKNEFYYAGLFKHYTIKREIFRLFRVLNELNFEVIFFGPNYLRLYKDVFNIQKFHHIDIPVRGAAENFEQYVNEIKEIHKNTENKTIVFHSAGQMLSAQLVYDLKDTNIWGIDIGRALDILIKDKFATEPTMYRCWTGLDEGSLNRYVDMVRSGEEYYH